MTTHSADFISKLRQIEEQANSVNAEIAPGLPRIRLQHIVVLAMRLRGRNEFDLLQRKHGLADIHRGAATVGFAAMPKADFIAKLRQIEEQANAAISELPPSLSRTRLQHIVVLAKTLRGRLEFGALVIAQVEPSGRTPESPA
jgi:hypothetical protein